MTIISFFMLKYINYGTPINLGQSDPLEVLVCKYKLISTNYFTSRVYVLNNQMVHCTLISTDNKTMFILNNQIVHCTMISTENKTIFILNN